MGKTIMGAAAVSLDGFIADENDDIGPLFDWLGSGDVSWTLPGSDRATRGSRASADFMTGHYANMAANIIGRRLFDLTSGWDTTIVRGDRVIHVVYDISR
jgi:dihydrofolate reductase